MRISDWSSDVCSSDLLIDSRDWKTDADLAEVYAVWGGYAYGSGLDGVEARGDMERVYKRVRVAAKNQDTREHDIVDSDDYFQYHGGMVAAVRALTGSSPEAYHGDSALPDTDKTRTLQEEPHGGRSEERRGGKEWGSKGRCGGAQQK